MRSRELRADKVPQLHRTPTVGASQPALCRRLTRPGDRPNIAASWMISRASPSTPSSSSPSTPSRRPTAATPACRWAPPTTPSSSGRATSSTIRRDPHWPDRDRFVLSAGHGSMLLYSLLHLSGYDLPLDELQAASVSGDRRRRAIPSRTSRPASRRPPVRSARASPTASAWRSPPRWPQARFPGLFNHRIWGIVSDGDMMEGIALGGGVARRPPAASATSPTSTTTTRSRSTATSTSRWTRTSASASRPTAGAPCTSTATTTRRSTTALDAAKAETERPFLILARTHIGNGAPHKHDTHKVHGEPLGNDETEATKRGARLAARQAVLRARRGARAVGRSAQTSCSRCTRSGTRTRSSGSPRTPRRPSSIAR